MNREELHDKAVEFVREHFTNPDIKHEKPLPQLLVEFAESLSQAPKEEEKKPWNFCETPEEKCTMNYCDENGCQNRKRNYVTPPQKINFNTLSLFLQIFSYI